MPEEGQIIIRHKGKFAAGSYLAHERAVELARKRWDKAKAAKIAAEEWAASSGGQKGQPAPQPVAPPPPPSSAARVPGRKPNPCSDVLIGPGHPMRVVKLPGIIFGDYNAHQQKAELEARLAKHTRRR